MHEKITATAASVLLFDCVTDNPDRRATNPNCLQRGDEVRIIDHELCFGSLILGWQPPWVTGSLQHLASPGQHIFRDALRGRTIDWDPITAEWKKLSDGDIAGYVAALPEEWAAATPAVSAAAEKIRAARDHIDQCAVEVQRVLIC